MKVFFTLKNTKGKVWLEMLKSEARVVYCFSIHLCLSCEAVDDIPNLGTHSWR